MAAGTEIERLITRYDPDNDGIEGNDVALFAAIDDYLGFGEQSWASMGYTDDGLFDLIDAYLGF